MRISLRFQKALECLACVKCRGSPRPGTQVGILGGAEAAHLNSLLEEDSQMELGSLSWDSCGCDSPSPSPSHCQCGCGYGYGCGRGDCDCDCDCDCGCGNDSCGLSSLFKPGMNLTKPPRPIAFAP